MAANTDHLREVFLDVAGEATVTERQEEVPSHDPVEEGEAVLEEQVSGVVLEDGLDDAVAGAETGEAGS